MDVNIIVFSLQFLVIMALNHLFCCFCVHLYTIYMFTLVWRNRDLNVIKYMSVCPLIYICLLPLDVITCLCPFRSQSGFSMCIFLNIAGKGFVRTAYTFIL